MPAERGRLASLNGRHHSPIDPSEMRIVPIKECHAVAADTSSISNVERITGIMQQPPPPR
jgi:hypothetical protein